MQEYRLTEQDNKLINEAVVSIFKARLQQGKEIISSPTLEELVRFAHLLPERLIESLSVFRLKSNSDGYFKVKALDISDLSEISTPDHFNLVEKSEGEFKVELKYLLISSLLGYPFGFKTQQANKLVHDIVPVKGHENEQMGSSSAVELYIHTEDSFHQYRGEFISLLCLRNMEQAVTITSRPDLSELSESELALLFQNAFRIQSDDSYSMEYSTDNSEQQDYQSFHETYADGSMMPVLYGQKSDPFIVFDPYYTAVTKAEYKGVYQRFSDLVKASEQEHVLNSGEIIFIDNQRAVHGRRPYQPRDDKHKRWFKRINISVDLRKSAHLRDEIDCPFIGS